MTRRAVLAAGGAVALGSLAGCTALDGLLNRVGERAIGTRTASPAGFYAGGETDGVTAYRSGPVDVRFVPPTLRADSRRIEIDGWSTTTTTQAQDYNSSRSNKPSTVWVPDPHDEDSDGDGIGSLVTVLDVERALLVYADAAIAAVDGRSSDDAKAALDAFIDATTTVRDELEGCSAETCSTVFEHADSRKGLARDASDAVDAGEWDRARRSLQRARRIVRGDIEDVFADLDSDGDGLVDGTESLYDYLDGEPTVGEHFAVSLPDASVRGGGPGLADELTPQRVLDYFTGERNAGSCGGSDRAVAVHRDLSCRDLLSATLTAPAGRRGIDKKDLRRGVVAFETSGGVVVTGATPAAADAVPILGVDPDNTVSAVESLDSWGEDGSSGEATLSPVLVRPVLATPADCPCPMPALFHVRRIRHEDQLLFVGGWHIDDGALYENAATLLVADGPNIVAGVTGSDVEDGGVDLRSRGKIRKKPGRKTYANMTLSTPYDPGAGHLPAGAHPVCRDDGELYCWGVQSREALARNETGGCPGGDGDAPAWSVVTALDAPVLHLVDAADASNDVKFKAGAELSKAVN
ncbi:EF-hand domain-containing protein [Halosimplex salinum]|uniref:EF-hand domain-containing protein n=1 Tax=Halosimplex salinum TaxID=1710538 RepID=UPI0013DE1BB9|nr:EF-hand domain-containing protein [Halosimplex salinum]